MNAADHSRWSEDLAAYMLGALEPGEAAEMKRHLEGCERCRGEMRWLEPALQALPEAIERREPPPRLRERLMAEARADAGGGVAQPATEPSWSGRLGFGSRGLRLAAGFAVIALAIAGVAGYEIGRDDSGGAESTVLSRQAGGISVTMIRDGDDGTLRLAGIDQLPSDKVLEAWVLREGELQAVPALFVPDRHGHAETRIADISGVDEVMVTEEPRGGSDSPTGEPIVTMSVPG